MENPVVSVCMITYNHEKFISEAIEGVLMQKTDFPIELIIGEDCSTDNTRKIVKEYEKKYPEIIVAQYPQTNLGMIKNFASVLQSARGKYIALCEGDDYWTDPFKLQKQVDFLELNHDYGLVHTNSLTKYQDRVITTHDNAKIKDGLIFRDLITHNFYISTLTVCVRKELLINWIKSLEEIIFIRNWKMIDYPLWLEGSFNTKFKYINETTACYRVLSESASHSRNKYKRYIFFQSVYDIKFYFIKNKGLDSKSIEQIKKDYYVGLLNFSKFNFIESTKGLFFLVKKKNIKLRMIFVFFKNLFF